MQRSFSIERIVLTVVKSNRNTLRVVRTITKEKDQDTTNTKHPFRLLSSRIQHYEESRVRNHFKSIIVNSNKSMYQRWQWLILDQGVTSIILKHMSCIMNPSPAAELWIPRILTIIDIFLHSSSSFILLVVAYNNQQLKKIHNRSII